ncbi:MAG: hypothetical protein HRU20_27260 [Pseudomonadales bacterium]|nr:hypothetical protein [Pseudomonadales bacterium]
MKVQCIKILSPATGKDLGQKSPWLTVGKTYVALALTIESGEVSRVLIESDENAVPKDFFINQFELIDENEQENWISKDGPDGMIWKAPASWLEEDFWDRFDEGDEQALSDFSVERDRMK